MLFGHARKTKWTYAKRKAANFHGISAKLRQPDFVILTLTVARIHSSLGRREKGTKPLLCVVQTVQRRVTERLQQPPCHQGLRAKDQLQVVRFLSAKLQSQDEIFILARVDLRVIAIVRNRQLKFSTSRLSPHSITHVVALSQTFPTPLLSSNV
jgi:hypothetical protein